MEGLWHTRLRNIWGDAEKKKKKKEILKETGTRTKLSEALCKKPFHPCWNGVDQDHPFAFDLTARKQKHQDWRVSKTSWQVLLSTSGCSEGWGWGVGGQMGSSVSTPAPGLIQVWGPAVGLLMGGPLLSLCLPQEASCGGPFAATKLPF